MLSRVTLTLDQVIRPAPEGVGPGLDEDNIKGFRRNRFVSSFPVGCGLSVRHPPYVGIKEDAIAQSTIPGGSHRW